MASCRFSNLVGGPCGPSSYNVLVTECISIKNCTKDISNHCALYKISDDVNLSGSESLLLLARAGKTIYPKLNMFPLPIAYLLISGVFEVNEDHLNLTVCPLHRDLYGVRWRSNKTKCAIPGNIAAHKSSSVKAQCGITTLLSRFLYKESELLIPVGTGKRGHLIVYIVIYSGPQGRIGGGGGVWVIGCP